MLKRLGSKWHAAWAVVIIAVAVLVWHWPVALTNRVMVGADSLTFFVPYWAYATESVREGRLPLWNPYLFSGVPFLANPPSALFYPFFWPFRLVLEPARAVLGAFVFHVWLGGFLTYLLAKRSLRLGFGGALMAGLVWAGSGYVAGQVEHISHLSAAAWLPGMLLLLDMATGSALRSARVAAVAGLSVIVALSLLTGHTQFSYIGLFAAGLYALWPLVARLAARRGEGLPPRRWPELQRVVIFAAAVVLGLLLAAVQLWPTWELAQLSARGGGLTYREVAAFSLPPRTLLYSLLPAHGQSLEAAFHTPAFPEFVAYVGVTPLVLAGLALRRRHPRAAFAALLVLAGGVLALGGYTPLYFVLYTLVPGFDLFRTPARWLSLYTLGMALLAGVGMASLSLPRQRPFWPRWGWLGMALAGLAALAWLYKPGVVAWAGWALAAAALIALWRSDTRHWRPAALVVLVAAELYGGTRTLPIAHPTTPAAVTSLRTAPAAILADGARGRVLSLSDLTFDAGDLGQQRALYAGQLNERELYDFHVATKLKEIAAPNENVLVGLASLDGYDGGLLPLPEYVAMQRLLLPPDTTAPDGRLWQRLVDVPAARVLDLFHVGYVISDKLGDLWRDGVYYDLQHPVYLRPDGEREARGAPVAALSATAVGIVSYMVGGNQVPSGVVVGEVELTDGRGRVERLPLRAGEETAEGQYTPGVAHPQATVARVWPDGGEGVDYISVLPVPGGSMTPLTVTVRLVHAQVAWVVRGVSLMDGNTGVHRSVLLSADRHVERIHSGDVKVYRVADALPRAHIVQEAWIIADEEAAIAAMSQPEFDPARVVVLAAGEPLPSPVGVGQATARVLTDEPERVVVEATLSSPGYLVLGDTFYPGWRATVDGQAVPVVRANVLHRAVRLEAGEHRVGFVFRPASLWQGATASAVAVVAVAGLLLWSLRLQRRGR